MAAWVTPCVLPRLGWPDRKVAAWLTLLLTH
jgi:hypothetical protein